jgi:hypothetical protein
MSMSKVADRVLVPTRDLTRGSHARFQDTLICRMVRAIVPMRGTVFRHNQWPHVADFAWDSRDARSSFP